MDIKMNKPKKSVQLGDPITEKETQVLLLCCDGCTAKETADKLNMASSTVSVHRRSIFKKLGVTNVAAAVYRWTLQSKR